MHSVYIRWLPAVSLLFNPMYQVTIPLNMLLLPNLIYFNLYHVKIITQIEHIHMKDNTENRWLYFRHS